MLSKVLEFFASFACLSVIFILTPPTLAATNDGVTQGAGVVKYGVLLDAGSSSTKLNVYSWNAPGVKPLPTIALITNERFENGLDSFDNDVEGLKSYIENILNRTKQLVPASSHATTPLFCMATAGLRFLTAKNAETLLENTRSVLANTTINPFWFTPSNVRILSGESEGVYSWIAANYLLGFFDGKRPDSESIGILEMGGGSTQITFIPHGPLFSEEYQVTLGGRNFHLYAQSYLQYGADAIQLKIVNDLAKPGEDYVDNPCMLRGDVLHNFTLEDGRMLTEFGSGSPEHCQEILREILKPDTGIHCNPKPCAIGSVYQPSVENITFFATQAFTYAPEVLKVVEKDKVLHIDMLEEAAFIHCNRTLESAVNESGLNPGYASDYCLMGLYIPTLLTVPYGFSRNTTNIRLETSVGGDRIDWSLGAMLVELSSYYSSDSSGFGVTCNKTESSTSGHSGGSDPAKFTHAWMTGFALFISVFYYII